MENGAVVTLESSWALNVADAKEATFMVCGDKGGVDTLDGVRVNYIKNNRQCLEIPDLKSGGVAFYEGTSDDPAVLDQRKWIDAVLGKGELCVKAEQALVVTQILEAIYTSAKTGKPVYIDD